MKKLKNVIILLIFVILICGIFNKSYAADTFSATLTPESSRVSQGSKVKVTLKLTGINVEGGIAHLTAKLDIDDDVLSVSTNDIKGLNDWDASYNKEKKEVSLTNASPVEEDTEVAEFTFQVKENTSKSSTTIKLTSIEAGNDSSDSSVSISDRSTAITIGRSITPTSSPSVSPSDSERAEQNQTNQTNNQVNETNMTSNESNNPVATQGSNVTTTKNEAVPYTGSEGYVIPLMLIVAILGIVSFVNYKKLDEK